MFLSVRDLLFERKSVHVAFRIGRAEVSGE
jgi:hypothetical protein